MKIYVNAAAGTDGDGTREHPFRKIGQAAEIARPGDCVMVEPGIYREYVDPIFGGTEEQRVIYISTKMKEAIISGAEIIKGWKRMKEGIWTVRVPNRIFGEYNPYTTFVFGELRSGRVLPGPFAEDPSGKPLV